MNKLIILNHKMSLLYDDLYSYIDRLNSIDTDADILVCPSSIYLEAFINNCEWSVGSQYLSSYEDYNHTGEISTNQLKSLGIEYTLVGHYERVREFKESNLAINQKLIASLDANIFPILCFGEDIDEDYKEVLPKKLNSYLKDIDNISLITFAYEPNYAIGTGALPTNEKIEEVTTFISNYLEGIYHTKPVILYGGSVDSSNAHDIINIKSIDGILVGAISSNIKEVERIVENI